MTEAKTLEEIEEVKMIPMHTEISEPFHNFLRKYLEFFGSDMTVDDLCRQMIYEETRRLHDALTEFVKDDAHYTGERPWFRKHRDIALTTGNWPVNEEDTDAAAESDAKEA